MGRQNLRRSRQLKSSAADEVEADREIILGGLRWWYRGISSTELITSTKDQDLLRDIRPMLFGKSLLKVQTHITQI